MDLRGDICPFPCSTRRIAVAHTASSCCVTAPLRFLPQMIKSLKKAMAPVLSDVSVEWVFPESTEVLVSPISTSCLFPGDHLVGYSIICDTSPYISNPRSVSPCCAGAVPGAGGVGVHGHKRASPLFVRGQEGPFSFLSSREMVGETSGRSRSSVEKVLAHTRWLLLLMDGGVGPVPSLCFPPGQEATLQYDAFPGVGQLRFLSLPGGGSRRGELEPLQRLRGLLPH